MKDQILELIKIAFKEDLNEMEDVTSSAIFQNEEDHFYLLAKDTGILCGIEIFEKTFLAVDPEIIIKTDFQDGDKIRSNEIIATIQGKVAAILQAERTALNLLSHLSGIATKTNEFVKLTKGKTKILDTRKTLPGLRKMQKYAVRCGGGENHRMGLYDMVMIKDNHIDAAGSIGKAVKKIRNKWGNKFQIEVETRNIYEVQQALDSGADRIMLDNMNLEMMQKAVKLISKRAETEASGNMTLDRISEVSQTGVDYISVGELTHTIKAFDFSLKRGIK
ncbi:MAG: carboxylating nicotinate-nucleotide diphosphorylase [Candidatus Tenebribacter davisii]|jgi:nicotinate-nucleotide pyrophosphorylase (carboxylating)|nr:carboxylating nicotinate-nucleotide diphosphorylase [Candidatus Tenebribacter davisii]